MTQPSTRTGATIMTPGSTLDVGDYVEHRGVWYRLDKREGGTRYTARFLGVARDGSHFHLLLDSTMVKAYRWDR